MEDFDLRKYLAENRLLKEEKTFNVYNDGGEPVLVNLDKATPSQEKLIRWEMPNITEPETSEEAQEIANEIMQLNSVEDVKQYYGDKRGWFNSSLKTLVGDAMVVYNNLAENKLLKEDKWVVYDTKTEKRLPNAGKIYKDRKAAQAFADKQENAEVASDTFYFEKFLKKKSVNEVSAVYVNKDAYNYKVGDIIGNTIDGFDFEVIRIEGDTVTVRDVNGNKKGGKEFKTYKDNMYKGGVGLKEFMKKELEDRNEPLYAKLVPSNGDAETLEGEMLRAINRIIYRYFNSGDKYYEGYGTETAGPAHSFLVNARHPQRSAMNTLFKEFVSDAEYERILNDVLDVILDHIESRQGKYTKNTLGGIFDYEPEFEDMEEDDDDYTYDYDDEYEDDDYYQE